MKTAVTSKAIDRLKRKLPPGRQLPSEFKLITSSDLALTVAWSSLREYGLTKSAEGELVPFLQIADGSLVAMWYTTDPPAIVEIGSHGESPRVVAKDFPNFLRSISVSQTGVLDIDEELAGVSIPGYFERPTRSGIAALQKKLDTWAARNSSLEPPRNGHGIEDLRKRTHATVKQMIRDGLSQVYSSRDDWSMSSMITFTTLYASPKSFTKCPS